MLDSGGVEDHASEDWLTNEQKAKAKQSEASKENNKNYHADFMKQAQP